MLGEGLAVTGGADVDAREMILSDQAVARLTASGVKADGQVIQITRGSEADIARVILRRAQELNVDLIMLGESLHGRASRLFRGSVADRGRAPPPILLGAPRSLNGLPEAARVLSRLDLCQAPETHPAPS